MPETPPTPPPYTPYQQPGMMPNNMPGNMPAAPAPDAAAAAAKPPGSGSPKAANAAFVGNLGVGIRSIA